MLSIRSYDLHDEDDLMAADYSLTLDSMTEAEDTSFQQFWCLNSGILW